MVVFLVLFDPLFLSTDRSPSSSYHDVLLLPVYVRQALVPHLRKGEGSNKKERQAMAEIRTLTFEKYRPQVSAQGPQVAARQTAKQLLKKAQLIFQARRQGTQHQMCCEYQNIIKTLRHGALIGFFPK